MPSRKAGDVLQVTELRLGGWGEGTLYTEDQVTSGRMLRVKTGRTRRSSPTLDTTPLHDKGQAIQPLHISSSCVNWDS